MVQTHNVKSTVHVMHKGNKFRINVTQKLPNY